MDVSWPGRAKEPYEISGLFQNGQLDDAGSQQATFIVDVFAAGNNVNSVQLDLSSMGFGADIAMESTGGNTWQAIVTNTPLAPVGTYAGWVKASTSSSAELLYNRFFVQVVAGPQGKSLANDVQPIFNTRCIGCHSGSFPPQGMNLSSGLSWTNTVNVNANESALKRIKPFDSVNSYLVGKIKGLQLQPPYNGIGVQMPASGGPLTQTQIDTIVQWIDEGALDN